MLKARNALAARRLQGLTSRTVAVGLPLLAATAAIWWLAARPGGVQAQPQTSPDPAVSALAARVDADRALLDLRRLSGEVPLCLGGDCRLLDNRLTGTEDLAWAVDYVLAEAAGMGYTLVDDAWKDGRWYGRNVMIRKPGVVTPTEEVFFVAHIDGVSGCPGSRCPAADDNGSGAVAALEMARAFSEASFERTVVLFVSTGEEQGAKGVHAFLSEASPESLEAITALVNADMIGYDGDDDSAMELYYGEHGPSMALAERMRDIIATYEPELQPKLDEGCG